MAGEHDPLEAAVRRTGSDTSEALVNVAIGLMRRVDERLERMESKFDRMDEDRRKEAWSSGQYAARLDNTEHRLNTNDKIRVGIITASVVQVFYALFGRVFK